VPRIIFLDFNHIQWNDTFDQIDIQRQYFVSKEKSMNRNDVWNLLENKIQNSFIYNDIILIFNLYFYVKSLILTTAPSFLIVTIKFMF